MVNRVIKCGCDHAQNKTEERKIIQTNLGAIIASLTIILFFVGFLFIDNKGLNIAGAVQLPYLCILPLIPWLNHLGLINHTKWLLFLLTTGTAFTSIIFAHGTIIWVHHFFMLFALLPIAFFQLKQWKSMVFLFSFNFSLFCFFAIYEWPHHPAIDELTINEINFLRIVITSFCILAILMQLVISEYHSNNNENQLQYYADIDALTGLHNRRVFIEQLNKKLKQSDDVFLLILDLDFFKRINDTAGHDAGDKALMLTSKTLKDHISTGETAARIGGEEFAMLISSQTDIIYRANTIRKSIAEIPLYFNDIPYQLTVSIGICQLQEGFRSQDVLKAADNALYEAKAKGRNRVVPFELK